MSPVEEDLLRVLAMTWRGAANPLSEDYIVRCWSLDFQWLAPSDSIKSLSALIANEWLVQNEEGISPNRKLEDISAPLGWWPRPDNLLNPPLNTNVIKKIIANDNPLNYDSNTQFSKTAKHVNDPRQRFSSRLAKYIAKKSGLELNEVTRRCHRKMSNLEPITEWMCLCLIAREQGLDSIEIAEQLMMA